MFKVIFSLTLWLPYDDDTTVSRKKKKVKTEQSLVVERSGNDEQKLFLARVLLRGKDLQRQTDRVLLALVTDIAGSRRSDQRG